LEKKKEPALQATTIIWANIPKQHFKTRNLSSKKMQESTVQMLTCLLWWKI